MEKIFYTDNSNFSSSKDALFFVLKNFFGIAEPKIEQNKNGKLFLKNNSSLFFSISHSHTALFIAFSNKNIGIDAELIGRTTNYLPIIKKFSNQEQKEILDKETFLTHWTVKESVIKWLGGSIARDLYKIDYTENQIFYKNQTLSVKIKTVIFNKHILSICGEQNVQNTEFIFFP